MGKQAAKGTQVARVLVVDDEPKICALLQALLEKEGYQVDSAGDGYEAESKIRSNGYEMVIADLKMPGMDGLQLAKLAREIDREITILVITAYATVDNAVKALRAGVDDYITKPFDIEELKKAVGKTLTAKRLRQRNRELMDQLKLANEALEKQQRRLNDQVAKTTRNLVSANRVLQKRVEELQMLNEISQAIISILDLDKLLGVCLELIANKMQVRRSAILLADDRGKKLVVKSAQGYEPSPPLNQEFAVGDGVIGWSAAVQEPLLIDEINRDPRFEEKEQALFKTGPVTTTPLISKGRLLGIVCVNQKTTGEPFRLDDVRLLSTIASQVTVAIENAKLYLALQENIFRTVQALVGTVEAKDPYTSGHSARVTQYALRIAQALGLSRESQDILHHACQLHDIGKIGIPESILTKPGPLTQEEWQTIRSHPVIGERILRPLDFLRPIRPIVRNHHENWDGTGYPDGLEHDAIPLLTRIVRIADAYDAMTSERPYRERPKTSHEAFAELRHCADAAFDAHIINALEQTSLEDDSRNPQMDIIGFQV